MMGGGGRGVGRRGGGGGGGGGGTHWELKLVESERPFQNAHTSDSADGTSQLSVSLPGKERQNPGKAAWCSQRHSAQICDAPLPAAVHHLESPLNNCAHTCTPHVMHGGCSAGLAALCGKQKNLSRRPCWSFARPRDLTAPASWPTLASTMARPCMHMHLVSG